MIISLIVAAFIINFLSVHGTCTKLSALSQIEIISTVCIDVVDYEFYLPSSINLTTLNTLAQSSLDSSYLSVLPNECKKSLKRLVCSNIYLKCSSTSNYHIFSDIGYPVPVPFERPCRSVCDDVNSKCLGLLNLFGLQQNCTDRYDYSYGTLPLSQYPYQYDQSNNNNYCNNISSTFEVASSIESYIYGESNGACAGIITELYIPPSSAINSDFSPILPPYTIQSLIENQLASYINLLPKWLGSECHFALRKYFCGSYMLKPQIQTFVSIIESFGIYADYVTYELAAKGVNTTAIMSFDFYLPSYPSHQVCEDYASKCGGFIELSGLEALVPDCSSKSSGIRNYPNSTQTIITLPIEGFEVKLTTDPNELEDSNDNNYKPKCPAGFVIPEDPDNSLVIYVPDSTSACAVSCKIPAYTLSEYAVFTRISDVGPNIGLPLVLFVLIIWMFDETRRKQYLVIIFNVIALIVTIQCVYMSSMSFEEKFCSSNAVPITNKDGLTACNVQSFFLIYFILAEALTWGLIAVDLFLKILTRVNTNKLWLHYISIIFTLPIIPLAILANNKQYGYYDVTFCLTSNFSGNLDIEIFVLPIIVIAVIGTLCMFAVIIKIIQTTRNVKTTNNVKIKSNIVVPSDQRASLNSFEKADSSVLKSPTFDESTFHSPKLELHNSLVVNNDTPVASDAKVNNYMVMVNTPDTNAYVTLTHSETKTKSKSSDEIRFKIKPIKLKLNVPWKMIRTPLIFVTLYTGVWVTIFLLRLQTYFNINDINSSFTDWAECVFTYYNGDDSSWTGKCGEHPKVRPDERLALWLGFIVNSHAIVVSGIFLLNPTIWTSCFNGASKYIPKSMSFRSTTFRKTERKSGQQ